MKVLLRHAYNARYLSAVGNWVHEASEAFTFDAVEKAIAYCQHHALTGLDIVLRYENPVSEVVLKSPVPEP